MKIEVTIHSGIFQKRYREKIIVIIKEKRNARNGNTNKTKSL
jgi:hypothetical protein